MTENNSHKYQVWAAIITATGGVIAAFIALLPKGDTQPNATPIQPVEVNIHNTNGNQIVVAPSDSKKTTDERQEAIIDEGQNAKSALARPESTNKVKSTSEPSLFQSKKESSNLEESNQPGLSSTIAESNRISDIKSQADSVRKKLKKALDKTIDDRKAINYAFWIEYFDKVLKYDNKSILNDYQEIQQAFNKATNLLENE